MLYSKAKSLCNLDSTRRKTLPELNATKPNCRLLAAQIKFWIEMHMCKSFPLNFSLIRIFLVFHPAGLIQSSGIKVEIYEF